MPKRTLRPSSIKKIRKQGFRARKATNKGTQVLKRRTLKGRWKIAS